jgi:hypothetical protein
MIRYLAAEADGQPGRHDGIPGPGSSILLLIRQTKQPRRMETSLHSPEPP